MDSAGCPSMLLSQRKVSFVSSLGLQFRIMTRALFSPQLNAAPCKRPNNYKRLYAPPPTRYKCLQGATRPITSLRYSSPFPSCFVFERPIGHSFVTLLAETYGDTVANRIKMLPAACSRRWRRHDCYVPDVSQSGFAVGLGAR